MQDCISKTTKRFSDTQNKKELKAKRHASLSLNSKTQDTINEFSESSNKKLHYQLSFSTPVS